MWEGDASKCGAFQSVNLFAKNSDGRYSLWILSASHPRKGCLVFQVPSVRESGFVGNVDDVPCRSSQTDLSRIYQRLW